MTITWIENLNAQVGGLGLISAINQGVFNANARALGINKASAEILYSTFSFSITDSTITAKDYKTAKSVPQVLVDMLGVNFRLPPLVWLI